MRRRRTPDLMLSSLLGVLVVGGLFVLALVSASFSLQKTGNSFFFINHQLLFGLLPGLVLGLFAYSVPIEQLKRWAPVLLVLNVLALVFVFVPGVGTVLGGSARWIQVGPITFQPSEPLKLTFILYLASWLAARTAPGKKGGFSIPRLRGVGETLLPFGVIGVVISALLLLQPDMSTLGVIGVVAVAMYFAAGTPFWHSLFILAVGSVLGFLLIVLSSYRAERLAVFLNPALDPLGSGYQLKQALIGIGSGGLFGTGLGLSVQKFGFLPEPISDSIFAVLSEETGFIGATFLIVVILTMVWRAGVIALASRDRFCQLAALGIATWLAFQSFVNIGSMLGILPLTGIPLPFVSYGGSALVSELIAAGVLLNISRYAKMGQ